jgi:hypothetical protein
MDGTSDIKQTLTDGEEGFDPRQAAALLDQSRRDARREFGLRPPLISALMGAIVLAGYGALWLSTRDQHPYSGPSPAAIVLVYVLVAVSVAVSVKVYQRATAGVSGPSVRQQRAEGIAIAISFIGSPVLQGALKHYGASHAVVYGMIPAAAPLIIVGTTLIGVAGSKADWPQFAGGITVVTAGIVAAFVGPSGAWLVAGIGVFLAVVGHSIASAVLDHA